MSQLYLVAVIQDGQEENESQVLVEMVDQLEIAEQVSAFRMGSTIWGIDIFSERKKECTQYQHRLCLIKDHRYLQNAFQIFE